MNGLSTLYVTSSTFEANYALQNGGAIYTSGYQYVQIGSSSFTSNYAGQKGSEYYALFSSSVSKFTNVTITNSSSVSSIYCDTSALETDSLVITANNGVALTGGAISCINCPSIYISKSKFFNLKAQQGGAIYI